MKRILPLVFCLCFLFSALCLAENRDLQNSKFQTTANASFPNPFRPLIDVFKKILGIRSNEIPICIKPGVDELILSTDQIILTETNKIEVNAVVNSNLYQDPLAYNYKVSGGKIIGKDEKVVWDLSGVKPGTYTITAAVDNGCGFSCGKTQTKAITVKE